MRPVRGGRHPASLARGRGASASSAAGSAASRRSCSVSKRALRAAAASASPGTLCTAKPDPLLHARIFRPQSSATKPTQSEQFLWTNAYLPMAKAGLFFARSANFSSTRLGREGHGMQCRVPELEESAIGLAPEDTGATRELKPRPCGAKKDPGAETERITKLSGFTGARVTFAGAYAFSTASDCSPWGDSSPWGAAPWRASASLLVLLAV
mmetsp:Transcript_67734/g.220493  ORF Transcript_67734/g.220493 Transcript_67734/m.220493 type:complete len:211 (+) Transcript_67734:206-838(+)